MPAKFCVKRVCIKWIALCSMESLHYRCDTHRTNKDSSMQRGCKSSYLSSTLYPIAGPLIYGCTNPLLTVIGGCGCPVAVGTHCSANLGPNPHVVHPTWSQRPDVFRDRGGINAHSLTCRRGIGRLTAHGTVADGVGDIDTADWIPGD